MESKPKFKRALNFNVVVEQVVLENKTAGGFDMSGYVDASESQQSGIVVSIGELCPKRKLKLFGIEISFLKKSTIKVGDTIVFSKFKVTSMTIGGVNYLIVPYPDLTLVI